MNIKAAWMALAPFNSNSRLLRRVLLGNAAFSTTTGLISLIGAEALTRVLGIPDPLLLPGLGVQLLLFAAFITWLATREKLSIALAWTIVALDFAWVAASAAALPFVSEILTTAGTVVVVAIAVGVGAFAAGQIAGIRQVQRG